MDENVFRKIEYRLYNYKNIDNLNKLSDIQIKKLLNDISVKPISYSEKISPTNRFSSDVENEIIRRDETIHKKIEKLKREKSERLIDKELINTVLSIIDEDEKNLVELRYYSKPTKSWANISQELNLSLDTCIKLRRKIIEKIAKLI